MADVTPQEKRFRVFGLRYTAINVGAAVGPICGAVLAETAVELPFLITAAIYLAYVVSLQAMLKRFGIKKIEEGKKEHVSFSHALQVVVRDKAFRLYIIGSVLTAIGYSQMSTTLAKFVEMTLIDGPMLFATLISINAVVVILFQMPLTAWAEKRTPLIAILTGNVMYAIGDIGFAFADSWLIFAISMVLFTFGEILTFTSGDVMIDRMAPEAMRGSYYGAKGFQNLGQFLGPWVGGMLLAAYSGTALFLTVAAVSMISSLFYWAGQRAFLASTSSSGSRATGRSL